MKEHSGIYIQSLAYFIMATFMVAITTLLLHEAGHAAFGTTNGCKDIKIVVFDSLSAYPYTEMSCNSVSPIAMGLSSFLFIMPFGIFIFLIPRIPERFLPVLMIGFNVMISAWDFQTYLNQRLFFPVFLIGTVILITGEVLFMKEEGFFIKHMISRKGRMGDDGVYDYQNKHE